MTPKGAQSWPCMCRTEMGALNDSGSIGVFLVEDHKSVLWGLERLIESGSPKLHLVGHATNCADAMLGIDTCDPDVVLLDLDLNGESGLDVLAILHDRPRPKVLVLSGSREPEIHEKVVMLGARGMINKSDDASVILRAIDAVQAGELWIDRGAIARVFNKLRQIRPDAPSGLDRAPSDPIATLTVKEREVIMVVVAFKGAASKVIAEALHLSQHTLRNHLASIYQKLDVHNRLDLYMYATQHGLHRRIHSA